MNKKILIFGAGKIGKCIYQTFKQQYDIAALVVHDDYFLPEINFEIPQIQISKVASVYPPENYEFIVGIGYNKINETRQKVSSDLKNLGYSTTNLIDKSVNLSKISDIGTNNVIFENVVPQGYNVIGNGNMIWSNAVLGHDSSMDDYNWISAGAVISGSVRIMSRCFFGVNSSTKHNIYVSSQTFVGANSHITENTGTNTAWVNTNAKKLKISSSRLIDFMER